MQQGRTQPQLLLHSVAVVTNLRACLGRKVEQLEQLLATALDLADVEAMNAADQVEELGPGKAIERALLLGHDAELPLDRDRAFLHVLSEHTDAPGRRAQQPGGQIDRGRLAGAVSSEQAEERAGLETKAHVLDSAVLSELLGDALELQSVGHSA